MRSLVYALCIAAVVGLAFWAYGEGYETRATEREVAQLEREIGARHQELSMLRAEWAYLNRPDRLHALAEMNFERLGLMPLAPDHFALADQVAYPPPQIVLPIRPRVNAEVLEQEIDGIVVMNHVFGADAEPRMIAPPTLADDGEQLP
ncbi:hypothetical protein SAMN04488095_1152 [Jannaschia pohangensis]|uniref:Cell division protein FtsL n=2 Tax=Jannaschia pohangensis TaxID=390807 RepID=A0A1I3IZ42_9RHOB|nr:hypothetical protein SAMN04488095_1152 [Jannaschia pohangensis]